MGLLGNMANDSAEILFQRSLQQALVSSSGMGRDVHSLMLSSISSADHDVAYPPTLQGALKDGFEEAVVACDMPEPCRFPSLHSCQKRFLWSHMAVELVPHPVVGLVLKAGG